MNSVGRNEPCPCGSGRKYKHCCLAAELERPPTDRERALTLHRMDERLVEAITTFGRKHRGPTFFQLAADAYGMDRDDDEFTEADVPLLVPWGAYGFEQDGRRMLDDYLESQGARLAARERAWLESQRGAHFSVWEVVAVTPGVGVSVRDLLSGEERSVREVSASETLVARDAVLARVVDHAGLSVFCGMHGRALGPEEAAEVVQLARRMCGARERNVRPEALRALGASGRLIQIWRARVRALDQRPLPQLCNTDGEPLLLTIDRFDLAGAGRDEVAARLATLEGAERDDDETEKVVVHFVRPGNASVPEMQTTLIGRATVTATALRLETNSIARADRLRARVEAACGDLVRHRLREHQDPRAQVGRMPPPGPAEPPPPEILAALRGFKEKRYAAWLDESIPALDDHTPRQAAASARLRPRLDVLLKSFENSEERLPAAERFDVASLRRALGLEPPSGPPPPVE